MIKVLVACEFSGTVRNVFAAKGCLAASCDYLPTESPGSHYQGSVFDIINNGWDLMIAHPPCTYLCNSGVRWLYSDETRYNKMIKAAVFFKRLLNAEIPYICLENPTMHGHAMLYVREEPSQCVQPYDFGGIISKRTCFWLKNLPRLKPTDYNKDYEQDIFTMAPSADRGKKRSEFPIGIALAMAEQWIPHIEKERSPNGK